MYCLSLEFASTRSRSVLATREVHRDTGAGSIPHHPNEWRGLFVALLRLRSGSGDLIANHRQCISGAMLSFSQLR